MAAQKPVLKVTEKLGKVCIKYVKHTHQALYLYCCRTGEATFTRLNRYNLNTIEDGRPNLAGNAAEMRECYGVYVDKDQQVGEQSGTVSIAVGTQPG